MSDKSKHCKHIQNPIKMAKEIKGLKPVGQMRQDLHDSINANKVSIDKSIHIKSDAEKLALKNAKKAFKKNA